MTFQSNIKQNYPAVNAATDKAAVMAYNDNDGVLSVGRIAITDVVADAETITIGANIYEFDTAANPGEITAGHIRVNVVAAQTAAAATTALVAAVNANETAIKAIKIADGDILLVTKVPGAAGPTLAETMTNGTVTEFQAGTAKGMQKLSFYKRVVTVADVTYGSIHVALNFVPTGFMYQVTDTDGLVKAHDGKAVLDRTNKLLKIDNSGTTDFAATDVISIIVWE